MKGLFFIVFLDLFFTSAMLRAKVSDADVFAMGVFLRKDFACASSNVAKDTATRYFLFCESRDIDEVDARDAENAKTLYSVQLLTGKYYGVWVMCDVSGYGMLLRKLYIGPRSTIYWADQFQSLAHLQIRPELGQLGVDRLAELSSEFIKAAFKNLRNGTIPDHFIISDMDKMQFLKSMDVLARVAIARPGN